MPRKKTRTLISAGCCRPEWRGERIKARTIPELCRRLSALPLEARYFFVCSGQCTDRAWEKCPWGTRFLAQIKAKNSLFLACHSFQRRERKRITHCTEVLKLLVGLVRVWPHHCSFPCLGHKLLTITIILVGVIWFWGE
jgi:hypothetical protein